LLVNKPLSLGDLRGTIYDFQSVGDVLPQHSHDESNVHISIVSRGSFRVWGLDFDQTLACGTVLDWAPHTQHGFEALEANSRLVNILKNHQP
jgi:quercetin dioxygenase-like cupin family protein